MICCVSECKIHVAIYLALDFVVDDRIMVLRRNFAETIVNAIL